MTKITKRDNYNSLLSLVNDAISAGIMETEEANRLCGFINHEIELMDKRSEKAKTYAKAKSAKAADELADAALVALRSMTKRLSLTLWRLSTLKLPSLTQLLASWLIV